MTAVAKGLIVFASYRSGHTQIYVMNADGSGQTNLTNYSEYYSEYVLNAADDWFPSWSPE